MEKKQNLRTTQPPAKVLNSDSRKSNQGMFSRFMVSNIWLWENCFFGVCVWEWKREREREKEFSFHSVLTFDQMMMHFSTSIEHFVWNFQQYSIEISGSLHNFFVYVFVTFWFVYNTICVEHWHSIRLRTSESFRWSISP